MKNSSNVFERPVCISVNKLKTTLKHILDVSERYAAIDLFNELCHAVASDENSQKGTGLVYSRYRVVTFLSRFQIRKLQL